MRRTVTGETDHVIMMVLVQKTETRQRYVTPRKKACAIRVVRIVLDNWRGLCDPCVTQCMRMVH